MLESRFPKTSEMIKDYHLNDLLKTASISAKGEHIINPTKIFNAMDKWSPELKKYVLPEGAEQGVLAAKQLIEALPNKKRFSVWIKIKSRVFFDCNQNVFLITNHVPGLCFRKLCAFNAIKVYNQVV